MKDSQRFPFLHMEQHKASRKRWAKRNASYGKRDRRSQKKKNTFSLKIRERQTYPEGAWQLDVPFAAARVEGEPGGDLGWVAWEVKHLRGLVKSDALPAW